MAAQQGLPLWQVQQFNLPGESFTDIRTVNLRKGRRKITDPLSAGTCTVTGRRPDLQPSVKIGDVIGVSLGLQKAVFPFNFVSNAWYFRVADYRINYGTIAAEDTWEMELEDALAYLGRVTLPTTTIASNTNVVTAMTTIASAAGLTQGGAGLTTATTSAQTVTNLNALDVYQTLANTDNGRVSAQATTVYYYTRTWWIYNSTVTTFTDTGAANTFKYTEYETRSLADNYADKVVVTPRGSSDVISGTGIFSYNLDSYSFDTQQAQNLADFMRGALDVDYLTPTRIAYLINGQDTDILDVTKTFQPTSVAVTFRGTTSVNQVLGYSYFGTQEETRAELYLANSDFLNYMILNDTTYGRLNYNRLGW